jgi:hypothetical protein
MNSTPAASKALDRGEIVGMGVSGASDYWRKR